MQLNFKPMPLASKVSGITYDLTAMTFHMLQRNLPGPNMALSRACCSGKSMGALDMVIKTDIPALVDAFYFNGGPIG
ncbi:hypothetical protein ACXHXG_12365 [Rhizobium sp. LEGMi198b]|uniref:hypothetical protein n=1 Tax=Rhizobium sp. CB3171 TaxID=3039157 RepID=UPI0024B0C1AB|nr:hypothetical protein [Rhizobium sp. CB3171]WFU01116.1 hypothetical protein QA648_13290 [Rhizobium sp. CB3171]